MTLYSLRGLPVPEGTDPSNVPADFQKLVQALDPGALGDSAPVSQLGYRIVFLVENNGDPITLAVPPILGTVYFDRSTARLWVPFTQLVQGVSTLSWYRIGTDADAKIATLGANQDGMVRAVNQVDSSVQFGSVALQLTGIDAGVQDNAWQAGVSFLNPFDVPPVVVVSNGDSVGQPNVVLGVQNVTATGFQVQIARSDVPFVLGSTVVVNYVAVAQ